MRLFQKWWLLLAFCPAALTSTLFALFGPELFIVYSGATILAAIIGLWVLTISKLRGFALSRYALVITFTSAWLPSLYLLSTLDPRYRDSSLFVLAAVGMASGAAHIFVSQRNEQEPVKRETYFDMGWVLLCMGVIMAVYSVYRADWIMKLIIIPAIAMCVRSRLRLKRGRERAPDSTGPRF